jgi:hypothetical protein
MIASRRRIELNGILAYFPDGRQSESHTKRPAAVKRFGLKLRAAAANVKVMRTYAPAPPRKQDPPRTGSFNPC